MLSDVNNREDRPIQPLRQIAERALAGVEGDGLAVVFSRSGRMTCVISLGLAPPVGSTIAEGSRLTRECIERARLVYSADAYHDSRVERSPAPTARSVLMVPILASGKTVGLIAAFARRPDSFNPRHFFLLYGMANAMSTVVAPPRSPVPIPVARPEVPPPEPAADSSDVPSSSSFPAADDPAAAQSVEANLAEWARWRRRHWRKRILIAVLAILLAVAAVTATGYSYQIGSWLRIVRTHIRWSRQSLPANPSQ